MTLCAYQSDATPERPCPKTDDTLAFCRIADHGVFNDYDRKGLALFTDYCDLPVAHVCLLRSGTEALRLISAAWMDAAEFDVGDSALVDVESGGNPRIQFTVSDP